MLLHLVALCVVLLTATGADAADKPSNGITGVYLMTRYPALTVRAGETTTIDLSLRNFNLPPSINERVGSIVGASRMSTARPTQTQIDQYMHAAAEFEGVLSQLRQLIEVDLQKLEKQMEAAGAPWTPGRVPEWKDQ